MLELLTHKLFLSSVSIVITLVLSVIVIRKYKLRKDQVFIYILLVLFWSSINLIRAYRKTYAMGDAEIGGLGMDGVLAANIAAAYGLISIFVRLPIFAFSDFVKSRKFMIALALVFVMGSSVWVSFNPSYTSLLTSSLMLGLGASMLSLFNVFFSETFDEKDALVSVSILSVAPLLAEFLVAPIQYLFTSTKPNQFSAMWMTSAVLAFIALIFLLFVKDNKTPVRNFSWTKAKQLLLNGRFMALSALGILVSFIRFATSGSNMVAFARLDEVHMSALAVAYLDVVFAMAQLIGGVLVGLYLKRKIGVKNTLILGLGLSVVFSLVTGLTQNSILLFWIYSLNGLGYGLTYNVLLGLAMQPFSEEWREISMGIYQTFFAIGIYYGDKIYALAIKALPEGLSSVAISQTVFLGIGVLGLVLVGFVILFFSGKNREFLEA